MKLEFGWDYISLGTLGFAQFGEELYDKKVYVEKKIIQAFYLLTLELNVPEHFMYYAHFAWMRCPYNGGFYWDYVLIYDRHAIDELEEHEDPDCQTRFDMFWKWVDILQSALSKNEETLLELCKDLYRKDIKMEVVYRRLNNNDKGLKAV